MEKSGEHGLLRYAALALTVAAMSLILSLPAGLYLWQKPSLTNLLSAVLSFGFFAAIFTMLRSIALQLFFGLLVMVLNMVEVVHILIFGGLISLGGVEAVLYVDPHEAREFAAAHAHLFLLGLIVVLIFAGLAVAKKRLDNLRLKSRLMISMAAVGTPLAILTGDLVALGSSGDVYLPTRIVEHYVAYIGVNPLTHTISGFAETLATRSEFEQMREERDRYNFKARRPSHPAEEELYVVVVGESSRRRNWSIYGYGRPTSPNLAAEPNLTVFSDALSPATTTSRSLPLSFSFATANDREAFYRTKSFLSAFREVGFKTYWISNQGSHRSAVGSEIALLMREADEVRTTNFGFWNAVLDEALLPELDAVLQDPAPRKLVILHTLGSHTNYGQRFPEGLEIAATGLPLREAHANHVIDDAQAETIDAYDKTIAYTDWLLSQIIDRHRQSGRYGGVIYFSDHGQRLYDDDSGEKGHGFSGFKAVDAEISLLIWTSDLFRTREPAKLAAIVNNANAPVSTADLAASMLDLAGIEVEAPTPTRSFFSQDYVAPIRKVLTTEDKIIEINPVQ